MKIAVKYFFTIVCVFFALKIWAQGNEAIVPNTYIFKTKYLISDASLNKNISNNFDVDFSLARLIPNLNYFEIRFNKNVSPEKTLLQLKKNNYIQTVQYNHYIKSRNTTPNDANFTQQWALNNTGQTGGNIDADIDAIEAWSIAQGNNTRNGFPITIAVIEVQGFDTNHEDIKWYINTQEIEDNAIDDDGNGYIDDYRGWNTSNNSDNFPISSHGTHVTGIACAKGNNSIGVSGVAWNTSAMPISVSSSEESKLIAAYGYAYTQRKRFNDSNGTQGAFVVATNASFGVNNAFAAEFPLWCEFYDELGKVGILNIIATTNSNSNIDISGDMPSLCSSPYIIVVTNTDATDNKAPAGYSTTSVDLGAPGTAIYSTLPNNNYGLMSGTSMATPMVSGAVAVVYSAMPQAMAAGSIIAPRRICELSRDLILQNVDVKPQLSSYTRTSGRLNLYNAVNAANSLCATFGAITNTELIFPIGENVALQSLVQNADNIQWQLNSSNISNQANINYVFTNTGEYNLSLDVARNSCTMHDEVIVKVVYPYDGNIKLLEPNANDCADTLQPKVLLKNDGYYDITSAQIQLYNNGNLVHDFNWNGTLKHNDSIIIDLPQVSFLQNLNNVELLLTQINNRSDDNPSNNQIIRSVNMTGESRITIDLFTDKYPNENTIYIQDENEAIIYQITGLTKKNSLHRFNVCLPVGCYFFSISDQFGDGICCDNGNGYFSLQLDGNEILNGSNFGALDSISFCANGNFNGITQDNEEMKNSVFPNPFFNKIFINLPKSRTKFNYLLIFNAVGQKVYEQELDNLKEEIDLSRLPSGLYNVWLRNNSGETLYRKIVKK